MSTLWLALAAFAAGVVDAVIGGGGMIQVPALFAVYPGALPGALLGTNKLASSIGTTGAALRYNTANPAPWPLILPAALCACLLSVLGSLAVLHLPAEVLRKAIPFVLLALLIYTLRGPIGLVHAPRHEKATEVAIAATGASAIGFYDGFLGPGTGAFYKLLLVRGLGYDFLNAAAPAKVLNVASNLGALVVFAGAGTVFWGVGFAMAVANLAGGQVGSLLAIRFGSVFIRKAFIATTAILILKTFADAFLR